LMIGELGGIPPLPPGIPDEGDPLSPSPDVLAAATGETERNPLTPTPTPASPEDEGEEGNWCESNPWACAGIIIGAAAGLTGAIVGVVEATRDIEVTQ
jgi:hypothetical protein